MDSCFLSLKSNSHLCLNRGENGFYGEKVRGGLNDNAFVNRRLKSVKKVSKLNPNVAYAIATPNIAKQPAVSFLYWWFIWPCLIVIFDTHLDFCCCCCSFFTL